MATVLTPDAAQALDQALTGICSQVGIDPSSARLIKYTMNAVYRAGPFVLRIARGPDAAERADRVTAVAGALTHMETPTIRLARDIGTRPVRHGDWIATVWEHVPTIATEAKPIDLAAPLRAIHRLVDLPVALPAWSPIDKFRRRLDAVRALDPDTADEVDRWALTELGRPFASSSSVTP